MSRLGRFKERNQERLSKARQRAVIGGTGVVLLATAACGGDKIPDANLGQWTPGQVPAECTDGTPAADPIAVAIRDSVRAKAETVRTTPAALPAYVDAFCDAAVTLDPFIHQMTEELHGVNAQLDARTGDRNALKARRTVLENDLKKAREAFSTVRVVLRSDDVTGTQATPGYWDGRVTEQWSAFQNAATLPERQAAAAQQAHTSAALSQASTRAQERVTYLTADQSNLKLDGTKDWLDEWASGQTGGSKTDADAFQAANTKGHDLSRSSVNTLLREENARYRDVDTRYQQVKPAHDKIPSVITDANDAIRALDSVEYWIRIRDQYSADCDRYERDISWATTPEQEAAAVSRYNQCVRDYNDAHWRVESAKATAERRLNAFNDGLVDLKQKLTTAEVQNTLSEVPQYLDSNWYGVGSYGWSWDGNQARQIEGKVNQAKGQLLGIQAALSTRYTALSTERTQMINARVAELMAQFPPA